MTGDLAKAGIECAAALTLSERSAVRRDIAVALSNRGVVKAVSGDVSGARDDFRRALELNAEFAYASDNLQRLRTAGASDA
jgi:Tfp pilus assembly protein PilF